MAKTHPYRAYIHKNGVQEGFVGGAYDAPSAVAIAAAVFTSLQRYSPSQGPRDHRSR
jgi:hypothetical protein